MEITELRDLAYVRGAKPGLTERSFRESITRDAQKTSQEKKALEAENERNRQGFEFHAGNGEKLHERIKELEALLANEKAASKACSKAMSEAQEARDGERIAALDKSVAALTESANVQHDRAEKAETNLKLVEKSREELLDISIALGAERDDLSGAGRDLRSRIKNLHVSIEAFRLGWKPKDGTEAGRDQRWRFEFDRICNELRAEGERKRAMRDARDALTVEVGRLQAENTAMRGVLRKSVRGCDPAIDYARCSEGGQGICPTEAACELLAQKHSANPSKA